MSYGHRGSARVRDGLCELVILTAPTTLLEVLCNPPVVQRPVIMPDFFVDHFVIGESLDAFIEGLRRLAQQGGGNLIGTRHMLRRGGNSVNTASALLRLGADPVLIVKTSAQGLSLLRALVDPNLDLSHVKATGALSSTVSIELNYEDRRVNLMVSDSGSARDFSIRDLTDYDVGAIREAGLVALLCLNHNADPAQLANDLFSLVRSESQAMTFMDIGDPSGRPDILHPLLRNVLAEGLVDILSINENEIVWLARAMGRDLSWQSDDATLRMTGDDISEELGVRIDLHTRGFVSTHWNGEAVQVDTFPVEPQVTCGAGDAWNAGDIYGYLLRLEVSDRLMLANAVAALYVSSSDATHPTREEIIEFLTGR